MLMLIIFGVGWVVEYGVLVCDVDVLQCVSEFDILVFDKIGILIEGKLQVVVVKIFVGVDEYIVLCFVVVLEQGLSYLLV